MRALQYLLLVPYSLWAYFWFFFIGFLTVIRAVFTIALIKENKGAALYKGNHDYERLFSLLTGMRYKVVGKEHFQQGQEYVITCNHKAIADLFIVAHALRGIAFRPLSKVELTHAPIIGFLFKHAIIPVDRTSKESRHKSHKAMMHLLKDEGLSLLIFPEGTRNRTPNPLKEFYDGAFRIAIQTQVPIMPMVILDTDVITPQGTPWLRPGTLTCQFLPPVSVEGLTEDDVPMLKAKVYKLMEEVVAEHQKQTADRKVFFSAY